MGRVNISIPDELLRRAKAADLNISKIARDAIIEELERAAKIARFDDFITELETDVGSPTEEQVVAAKAWANKLFGPTDSKRQTA